MEAFGSIVSNLLPNLGVADILKGATGGLGLLNQFSLASKEKQAMDRALYYSKHPEAIGNIARTLEKPLDAGLTKGVGNIVNASLAEQGLGQAPGIQSQVLAQALAPYQQNAQSMAINEALAAIGLPTEALKGIQSTMRPDQLALLLKGILPTQNPTPPPSAPTSTQADTGLTPPIFGSDPSQGGVNA